MTWRDKPDPHCCTGCNATEAGCEAALMFRGRGCCTDCNHDDEVTS